MLAFIALLLSLLACAAWVYVQARRSGESRAMGLVLAPIGGLVLTVAAWWLGISVWGHGRDKTGPLPAALEVSEEVFAAESGGMREGCGLHIHRLSEAARMALAQRGLDMLRDAREGRENPQRYRYEAWQAARPSASVRGMDCTDVPPDVSAMISKALNTGFTTQGSEFDLLADPVSGIVVFSFNG